jgi:hypothetical protein
MTASAHLFGRLQLSRVKPPIDAQGCFRSPSFLQNPLTLDASRNTFCFFAQAGRCVGETFLK